jgi:hypothetical protein
VRIRSSGQITGVNLDTSTIYIILVTDEFSEIPIALPLPKESFHPGVIDVYPADWLHALEIFPV